MLEKKELNQEQLNNINGGDVHDFNDRPGFFLYGVGYHVEINTHKILFYQFTSSGIITKAGYRKVSGGYSPAYYITCKDDPDDSGWYDENDLQDSTITHWTKLDASTVTEVNQKDYE